MCLKFKTKGSTYLEKLAKQVFSLLVISMERKTCCSFGDICTQKKGKEMKVGRILLLSVLAKKSPVKQGVEE